jgi:cytochrome c-type biogenesis protein
MTLMFGYIKRHFGAIVFVGGAVLIAMGVLVWTGELFRLNIEAQNFLRGTGLDFFNAV